MPLPTRSAAVAVLAFAFVTAVAGCGDSTAPKYVAPVASVTVTPGTAQLQVGTKTALAAAARNSDGLVQQGKAIVWSTSAPGVAAVDNFGIVTAVAPGSATVTASSEGKSGSAEVTVNSAVCAASDVLSMNVGQVVILTAAQKARLCLGGSRAANEYSLALISINFPSQVTLDASNTTVVTGVAALPSFSSSPFGSTSMSDAQSASHSDADFIERQRHYFEGRASAVEPKTRSGTEARAATRADAPVEGTTVLLNVDVVSASCAATPILHQARVVKVLRNTIIYNDIDGGLAGFTEAEMIALGTEFDTLSYPIDTLNFGAPTDVDHNGRVGVIFTAQVNRAGYGGAVRSSDLVATSLCPSSNVGEYMYVSVFDPLSTNGYDSLQQMLGETPGTLAHEMQHIINAGARVANTSETTWLNEGLSHIAQELLFYAKAGLTPGSNLTSRFNSSAASSAFGEFAPMFAYYSFFLQEPNAYSPIAGGETVPSRGAIWNLLRFAADRKGGNQAVTWRSLVNPGLIGTANLGAAFGGLQALMRDWAVANIADDAVANIAPNYQFPSWNFRGFNFAAGTTFPLQPRAFTATPVTIQLVTGGSAYFRFGVAANAISTVTATSNGLPAVPDFMLVRTR